MKSASSRFRRHRFPPEIISYAVWVYHRFCMSFRDVEDLLAERGIIVSYEAVRQWCLKFGSDFAKRLKNRQGRLGDTWHVDELFVRINGGQHYLWRAVDQDGDVIDILLQSRRDQRAAERFFRRLLRSQGKEPFRIITDRLKSYGAARRTILPYVLLEGIPAGMSMVKLEQSIGKVHGILAVHDLHVWMVGSGVICCSCHVMVAEQSIRSGEQVLRAVNEELRHHFGITHTTTQVEVEGCADDDMYCTLKAMRNSLGKDHRH
jgi:transposase-like protein